MVEEKLQCLAGFKALGSIWGLLEAGTESSAQAPSLEASNVVDWQRPLIQ